MAGCQLRSGSDKVNSGTYSLGNHPFAFLKKSSMAVVLPPWLIIMARLLRNWTLRKPSPGGHRDTAIGTSHPILAISFIPPVRLSTFHITVSEPFVVVAYAALCVLRLVNTVSNREGCSVLFGRRTRVSTGR